MICWGNFRQYERSSRCMTVKLSKSLEVFQDKFLDFLQLVFFLKSILDSVLNWINDIFANVEGNSRKIRKHSGMRQIRHQWQNTRVWSKYNWSTDPCRFCLINLLTRKHRRKYIDFFFQASERAGFLNPQIWLANHAHVTGPAFYDTAHGPDFFPTA